MSPLLKTKTSEGFTLIESTVAVMVLLVGLFAVMQFFPFGLEIIGDSNNRTIASNLALSKLEEVRSLDYDAIATGTIEAKQVVSSDPTSYLHAFQRETTVETVDENLATSTSDVGLKKITVTVFWQSPVFSSERTLVIDSMVADF